MHQRPEYMALRAAGGIDATDPFEPYAADRARLRVAIVVRLVADLLHRDATRSFLRSRITKIV